MSKERRSVIGGAFLWTFISASVASQAAIESFSVSLPSASLIPVSGGKIVDSLAFPTFNEQMGTLQGVTITTSCAYQFNVNISAVSGDNTPEAAFSGSPSLYFTEPSFESTLQFNEPVSFYYYYTPAYFNPPAVSPATIVIMNANGDLPNYDPIFYGTFPFGTSVSGTLQGISLTSSQTFISNNLTPYETSGSGSASLGTYVYDPAFNQPKFSGYSYPTISETLASLSGTAQISYCYSAVPEPLSVALVLVMPVCFCRSFARRADSCHS